MSRAIPEFTAEELERYSRQLLLPEVGGEGQKALMEARVLIVGLGGLGAPVSLYLAAAGIGKLGLVEHDTVDRSNLQRQILYTGDDIGKSKARIARARLSELNPHVEIISHEERLTAENALRLLEGYDFIVDGTDTFSSRYLINDACVLAGKPLVYASVSRFEGQLSVVLPGAGPCYRCLYPEIPPPDATPSCAEGGVLGVVPGTLALLQATEVLKLILKRGKPLSGRVLFYDALNAGFREVLLKRDSRCAVCGDHPRIRELTPGAPGVTAVELARQIGAGTRFSLIDVRELEEFASSRIPGAILIPLGQLPERVSELDTRRRHVVYCRSGARSAKALIILRNLGFLDVLHLEGGYEAYKRLDSSDGIQ